MLLTVAVNRYVKGLIISEDFRKASYERQMKIINAGYKCFGKDGYKKTAMSEIAAEAGVAKSLLFHYFDTKKGFYRYLYNYASDTIISQMEEGGEDFFECIEKNSKIKIETMKKHPGMYSFLLSVVKDRDGGIMDELRKNGNEAFERATALLFKNVDWSRFKSDFARNSAYEMLFWVSEGCIRRYGDEKNADEMAEIMHGYLNLLKQAFYEEEYL